MLIFTEVAYVDAGGMLRILKVPIDSIATAKDRGWMAWLDFTQQFDEPAVVRTHPYRGRADWKREDDGA